MEIERKFKIRSLPENLKSYPYHDIRQAYLCFSPTVRIRKEDDTYYLTYKNGGGLAHEEANLPLTGEAYELLLSKREGKIIEKRRYLIPYQKYIIELDVFQGELEGLFFAEVEFPTVAEAENFVTPDWFSEDVTFDENYHNAHLARR